MFSPSDQVIVGPLPADSPAPPLGDADPACAPCACPCCDGLPPVQLFENYTHLQMTGLTAEAWHTRSGSATVTGEQDPTARWLRDNPSVHLWVTNTLPGSPPFPLGHLRRGVGTVRGGGFAGLDPIVCEAYFDGGRDRYLLVASDGMRLPAPQPGDAKPLRAGCRDGIDRDQGGTLPPLSGRGLRLSYGGRQSGAGPVGLCDLVCVERSDGLAPRAGYPHLLSDQIDLPGTTPAPRPDGWPDEFEQWDTTPPRLRPLSDYSTYLATHPVPTGGAARRVVPRLPPDSPRPSRFPGPLAGTAMLDQPVGRPLPATVQARLRAYPNGSVAYPGGQNVPYGAGTITELDVGGVPGNPTDQLVSSVFTGCRLFYRPDPTVGNPNPASSEVGFSPRDANDQPSLGPPATVNTVAKDAPPYTLRLGFEGCNSLGPVWNYAGGSVFTHGVTVTVGPVYGHIPLPLGGFTPLVRISPGYLMAMDGRAGYAMMSYFGANRFGPTDALGDYGGFYDQTAAYIDHGRPFTCSGDGRTGRVFGTAYYLATPGAVPDPNTPLFGAVWTGDGQTFRLAGDPGTYTAFLFGSVDTRFFMEVTA